MKKPGLMYFVVSLLLAFSLGCSNQNLKMNYRTFHDDYELIRSGDPEMKLLKDDEGKGMIIVSPGYQGKVFTSSFNGMEGRSLGWVNEEAIKSKDIDPQMNAYGGENRLWIGPEGSKYSIFFAPGEDLIFEDWNTPPPLDSERWKIENIGDRFVVMSHEMKLLNHVGSQFHVRIVRTVSLLKGQEISENLDILLNPDLNMVAYETINVLINSGANEWTRKTGSICIWMLDMFAPSDETIIIVPFKAQTDQVTNAITSDYFGAISSDRLVRKGDKLFFLADGKSRGKLGVAATHALPWAASYDSGNKTFTFVQFDLDPNAVYLNQEWRVDSNPFLGDAVNAYNDGPLEDGSQLGPFYELESCSPGAFLKGGESLRHAHHVYHFSGDDNQLAPVIEKLTGMKIKNLNRNIFK
ncbi:DUF6786 family protein [Bacteroidota bacterium]